MVLSKYKLSSLKMYLFFVFWIFYFNILPPSFVSEFKNDYAYLLSVTTLLFFTIGYGFGIIKKNPKVYLKINTLNVYKFYYLYIVTLILSISLGHMAIPLLAFISGHLIIKLLESSQKITAMIVMFLSSIILFNNFTRMFLLMMFLYIFIYFYIKSKKIYLLQILLLAFGSFSLLVTMLFNRVYHEIDFVKIFDYLKNIEPAGLIKLIDNYFVYEAYLKTIEYFPKMHDYLYGNTIIRVLFFWIPREVWENKPEGLTSYVARLFFGTSRSAEYSTGMTITGEFYINFGVMGVVIFSLLLGYISAYMVKRLLITNKEYVQIISLMFIVYFPHIARGGSSTTIIMIILYSIIFVLFFKTDYFYKKIVWYKK